MAARRSRVQVTGTAVGVIPRRTYGLQTCLRCGIQTQTNGRIKKNKDRPYICKPCRQADPFYVAAVGG